MKWFWISIAIICVIGTLVTQMNPDTDREFKQAQRELDTEIFRGMVYGDWSKANDAATRYRLAKERHKPATRSSKIQDELFSLSTGRLSDAERADVLRRIEKQNQRRWKPAMLGFANVKATDALYDVVLRRYNRFLAEASTGEITLAQMDVMPHLHRDVDLMLKSRLRFHGKPNRSFYSVYRLNVEAVQRRCDEFDGQARFDRRTR